MTLAKIKAELLNERRSIRDAHRQGRDSAEITAALCRTCDQTLRQVYHLAWDDLPLESRSQLSEAVALVAVGGYGRSDLAPFSDIDLLFLTAPRAAGSAVLLPFVSRLVRDLWDVGLKLSHSVRTVAECLTDARGDLTVRTALADARVLIGKPDQLTALQEGVRRLFATRSTNRFIDDILAERGREHHDYHAPTVLLLEPNVKKSSGGLRDIHVVRWVALARYGTMNLHELQAQAVLSESDAAALHEGQAFLQHLRHEMHFHADSAQDVLTRDEQIRLADRLGFRDEGGLLGVERFMRHYYRLTGAVNDAALRFVASARREPLLSRVVNHVAGSRVENDFLLSRSGMAIAPDAAERVLGNAERILHLFDCARGYGANVEHATLDRVRSASSALIMPPEARRRFLDILERPSGLGHLLRDLHRSGLLSRLLPGFAHARGLIQFNLYHRYTVDEHTLRAVDAAVAMSDQSSTLGQAYREVHHKALLHLAILLHDLGKGFGEDHCELGRELAERTAREFELNDHDRQVLVFLVHQHLLMSQIAFRRDLSDPATIVQFARAVATPQTLRMLYVLTAADTTAVSPENWTTWKASLLDELYLRTTEELTGEAPLGDGPTRIHRAREELARVLAGRFPARWLRAQLGLMPGWYLQTTPPDKAARHLEVLKQLREAAVHVDADYLPETNFVEYTVFTRDDLTEGIFSKIAGVLAAGGFQIVDARIITRPDGVVIDTFTGQDLTFAGRPHQARFDELAGQIEAVLSGRLEVDALLSRRRLPLGPAAKAANGIGPPRPQVEVDNETSPRYTIIEVFAPDRLGLLYTITRTLFELGLSVHSAKISTHADQVIDAFYVTNRAGAKVSDASYLDYARLHLLNAIECQ